MFFNEKYFPSTRNHDDDEKKLFYTQAPWQRLFRGDYLCAFELYFYALKSLFSRQSNKITTEEQKNPFSVVAKSAAAVVRLRLSEAHKATLHMSSAALPVKAKTLNFWLAQISFSDVHRGV